MLWAARRTVERIIKRPCLQGKFGWGGRIRTFTILINSEVSYRLDHAPAGGCVFAENTLNSGHFAKKQARSIYIEYHVEYACQAA
jgi:hypothetical protein